MNLLQAISELSEDYRDKQFIILSMDPNTSIIEDIVEVFYSKSLTAPIHPELLDILYNQYMQVTEIGSTLRDLPTCILIGLTYTTGRVHRGDLSRDNLLRLLEGDEPIVYQLSSEDLFVEEYILK